MAQQEASEALKEKLGKAESMEDVVRAFSEEGIEVSAEQLEAMRGMGCDILQGFWFSQPVSVEEFEEKYLKDK